jgi:hypothetical protein
MALRTSATNGAVSHPGRSDHRQARGRSLRVRRPVNASPVDLAWVSVREKAPESRRPNNPSGSAHAFRRRTSANFERRAHRLAHDLTHLVVPIVHGPASCSKPPLSSSSGPPGACMTPSRSRRCSLSAFSPLVSFRSDPRLGLSRPQYQTAQRGPTNRECRGDDGFERALKTALGREQSGA